MSRISNGARITLTDTGESWHTLEDWDLAMEGGNPIGEPVVETHYVDVPGRNGLLDYSEALTGMPVYKERVITAAFGGKMDDPQTFRRLLTERIHGRRVRIVFDDTNRFCWEGRAEISDVEIGRRTVKFTLMLPHADPFGYERFETREVVDVDGDGETPTGYHMPSSPAPRDVGILVTSITRSVSGDGSGTYLEAEVGNASFYLSMGENGPIRIPASREPVTWAFRGAGTLELYWREGCL